MKIHCIIGMYIVFMVALMFGFNTVAAFDNAGDAISNEYSTPMNSSPGSQHNILLIQVDQINTEQPQLQSVWLMAYYANNPRVDLLPIYPALNSKNALKHQKLADQFALTKSGEPDEEFWLMLRGINTWWNGYLMMDNQALKIIEDHLVETSVIDNPTAIQAEKQPRNQKFEIKYQTKKYQELCQGFSNYKGKEGFYHLFFSLIDDIRSNLKPGQLHDIWQLLRSYGSNLDCDFPSFYASILK